MKHITGAGLDMYCMYNDSGKRIRKTVNGVTTDFYLDGSAILMQTSSDGSRIDFFYDDKGNVFAMKYQNEMYFYRKNLFGDILGILDSHGTELVKYEYNSWGKLLNLTDYSSNGLGRRNPFRFKGYYYDEEPGMYYLNSRYYDPETGRFVSADDVEFVGGSPIILTDRNLYVYCENNPIHKKDGQGQFAHILLTGAVSAAFGMITTVVTNVQTGGEWHDGLLMSGVTGFASGALTVSGLGPAGQALGQGIIAGISEAVNLKQKSEEGEVTDWDVAYSVSNIAMSVLGGAAGNKNAGQEAKRTVDNFKNKLKGYMRVRKKAKEKHIRRKKWALESSAKYLAKNVYANTKGNPINGALAGLDVMIQKQQKPKKVIGNRYYMKW